MLDEARVFWMRKGADSWKSVTAHAMELCAKNDPPTSLIFDADQKKSRADFKELSEMEQ